jgi:hypothetical protein
MLSYDVDVFCVNNRSETMSNCVYPAHKIHVSTVVSQSIGIDQQIAKQK